MSVKPEQIAAHYFNKGRCSGHHQFNGRYCRDVAGPERWCIHCAGYRLLDALGEKDKEIARLRAQCNSFEDAFDHAKIRAWRELRIVEPNMDQCIGAGRVYYAAFETAEAPSSAEAQLETAHAEIERLKGEVTYAQQERDDEAEKARSIEVRADRAEPFIGSLTALREWLDLEIAKRLGRTGRGTWEHGVVNGARAIRAKMDALGLTAETPKETSR